MRLPSDQDISGRDLGADELEALRRVLAGGHLISTRGEEVPALEQAFAGRMGTRHAIACASGSAALQAAYAALDGEPGDEVVTTPITDMGALLGILYEGLIPVFADVDPQTGNVTAETLAPCIGPRTRAVVATHLFGRPCAMDGIRALCQEKGVVLIEDAAQAFLAEWDGALAGRFGTMACFSFQQGKHMTTGEGGIVVTDDDECASRLRRYINKGWAYGSERPDHRDPGLNYRMTELQGAIGRVQLGKLDGVVERRRKAFATFCEQLCPLPGIGLPPHEPRAEPVHWRLPLLVDPDAVPGGTRALAAALRDREIPAQAGYVGKPAFECQVLRDAAQQRAFAALLQLRGLEELPRISEKDLFAGCYAWLDRILVLPWNEHYQDEHLSFLARGIESAVAAVSAREAIR